MASEAKSMGSTPRGGSGLELSIVTLDCERRDVGDLVWFALGASKPIDALVGGGGDPVEIGTALARADRDAAFALVDRRSAGAPMLHLWRGIFGAHTWYVADRSDGRMVVSDDFRNALAALPVAERTPGDESIIQHYLYREVIGTTTNAERIRRVGHGDHIAIDLVTGERDERIIDCITSETDPINPEQYLDIVEEALDSILSPLRLSGDAQLSFSGGVDSTLLASFLGDNPNLLTVVPDTPEFLVETEYAREAADLLGVELEEMHIPEASYLQLLEAAVTDAAKPPRGDMVPMLVRPYADNPGGTFVIGEGADAVFGTGGRSTKIANLFRVPLMRSVVLGAARIAPSDLRRRVRLVLAKTERFQVDPMSLQGYAAVSQVYGDTSFIRNVAGSAPVDAVLRKDLNYTLDRVELASPDDPFMQHIEIGEWAHVLAGHADIDRDHARAHRARVLSPFTTSAAISALTRIPVTDRLFKGFTGKWILKDLLAARLPGYDVGKRKRHTDIPFGRYCTDGPLTHFWDLYEAPEIFTGQARSDLLANSLPEALMWKAMSRAVWEERVMRNRDLTPHDPNQTLHVD